MKAIKFVILGAGVLGLIAFFLPYFNWKIGDETDSPTGLQVLQGYERAEKGADALQGEIDAVAGTRGLSGEIGEVKDLLDVFKAIIVILFLPALVLAVIGGVGLARGKLERVGGVLALVVGVAGLGLNGFAMAGLSAGKIEDQGLSPGIALYIMLFVCTIGFICGLLTLIKPDRGGRFG